MTKAECLGLLAATEVQEPVKISSALSRLWGEGGRRPGEGSTDNGDEMLGGMRLLAKSSFVIRISFVVTTQPLRRRAAADLSRGFQPTVDERTNPRRVSDA